MLSLESACLLLDKSSSLENLQIVLQVGEVVPLQHQPLGAYPKIHTMKSAIFMINICIYNHPFKVFRNRKYEGVEDLMCGSRETN
jgi:hypothetical protein